MKRAHVDLPTLHCGVKEPVLRAIVRSCLGERFAGFVKPTRGQREIHRTARTPAIGRLDPVVIVARIHQVCQQQLLLIVDALGATGFFLCFGQSRQEHGGQDGNDGNDDQQLNESESSSGGF